MLSRRTVEIGLVPLGAIGMTAFGIDLWWAQPGASAHAAQVAAGAATALVEGSDLIFGPADAEGYAWTDLPAVKYFEIIVLSQAGG